MAGMNLYGELVRAQFESLSADPTPGLRGRPFWNTALGKARIDTGTSIIDLGSGSAGINYVTNGDGEGGTTGWATYADAAGTSPVDGTAGSASVTITQVTSSPLRGLGMLRITKDAVNRQGQGVSYDFTIAAADKAKVLNVSFEYQVSASFASGDSSDVRVWVYDVTNSTLIPVAPNTIQGGTGLPYKFTGTFQSASNSTSYRLIFHVATTNASAWTFDFDNLIVSPQVLLYGAPVTDWKTFTPTGTWTANVTYNGLWRRVGDSMHIVMQVKCSGAPTSASLFFHMPAGYSIDTAKMPTNLTDYYIPVGTAQLARGSGGNGYHFQVFYANATNEFEVVYQSATTGLQNVVTQADPVTFASGDTVTLNVVVPILGWGSSVLMSNDTDTRVVAAKVKRSSSNQTISNNTETKVQFNGKDYDTHGAFDSTTNYRYTVAVPGVYRFGGSLVFGATTATGQSIALLKKNGSAINQVYNTKTGAANVTWGLSFNFQDKAVAGDYYELFYFQDTGGSLDIISDASVNGGSHLTIERLSGPSAIAATETIAATYSSSSSASITGSATIVNFDTKIIDSHNAVTVGASWKFTAPVSGLYSIKAALLTSAGTNTVNGNCNLQVFKNGSTVRTLDVHVMQTTASVAAFPNGECHMSLLAGDYIDIRVTQVTGNAFTISAPTYVDIRRVGNYVP